MNYTLSLFASWFASEFFAVAPTAIALHSTNKSSHQGKESERLTSELQRAGERLDFIQSELQEVRDRMARYDDEQRAHYEKCCEILQRYECQSVPRPPMGQADLLNAWLARTPYLERTHSFTSRGDSGWFQEYLRGLVRVSDLVGTGAGDLLAVLDVSHAPVLSTTVLAVSLAAFTLTFKLLSGGDCQSSAWGAVRSSPPRAIGSLGRTGPASVFRGRIKKRVKTSGAVTWCGGLLRRVRVP